MSPAPVKNVFNVSATSTLSLIIFPLSFVLCKRLPRSECRFRILFDFVRLDQNSNSRQNRCSICSIAEPNRTPIVRLSSTGFLFDFVRLDNPGEVPGHSWS